MLVLADLGIALVGTLVAALVVRSRARDMLGPLLALPLLMPIVIGAASALAPLLERAPAELCELDHRLAGSLAGHARAL